MEGSHDSKRGNIQFDTGLFHLPNAKYKWQYLDIPDGTQALKAHRGASSCSEKGWTNFFTILWNWHSYSK
jgi:hypothetical protein